jgi:hypothetical protein
MRGLEVALPVGLQLLLQAEMVPLVELLWELEVLM